MENSILVSDWEKVEKDDFYLSDDYKEYTDITELERARELQKESGLYLAYIVNARDYIIYRQMDAGQVFINSDGDVILYCESTIINNDHKHRQELN